MTTVNGVSAIVWYVLLCSVVFAMKGLPIRIRLRLEVVFAIDAF